jgi:NAD(P)-dependent dehydrogenase (short-subunit alcohol dehydrogenase family)
MSPQRPSDVTPIGSWDRLLDGRVAVVTGAGAGIGAAISSLFAAHGALVEMAEVDEDRALRTRQAIESEGGTVRSHVIDVTSSADIDRLATDVLDEHGRVDVVVNNVGDYRPLVRFEDSTSESWNAMYEVNLHHVFAVTRAFLGPMTDRRSGSIVNIHSVEGLRGYPGDPVYAAMKAGVAHFTTSLAVAVGRHGVRVNGIGPDLTQTPQVDYLSRRGSDGSDGSDENDEEMWASWAPVGRLGWPEDQARVALFLASDLSGYVTGHNIPVDGGTRAGGGWFYSPSAGRFVNRPRSL